MEESAVHEISAADFEEIESVHVEKENFGFVPGEGINTSVEQTIAEEAINTKQESGNASFKGSGRYYGKTTHKYADENFSAIHHILLRRASLGRKERRGKRFQRLRSIV